MQTLKTIKKKSVAFFLKKDYEFEMFYSSLAT